VPLTRTPTIGDGPRHSISLPDHSLRRPRLASTHEEAEEKGGHDRTSHLELHRATTNITTPSSEQNKKDTSHPRIAQSAGMRQTIALTDALLARRFTAVSSARPGGQRLNIQQRACHRHFGQYNYSTSALYVERQHTAIKQAVQYRHSPYTSHR